MKKLNKWLGVKITIAFSTMWAFYMFVAYGLIPLIWPQYQDKILYWSNFLQLIALPALAVGAAVLSEKAEQREQETHDAVMNELSEIKSMHEELQQYISKEGSK